MMPIFGHHAHGFVEVEIMGRPFPDGPTEHGIAIAAMAIAIGLVLYGGYALARDLIRRTRSLRSAQAVER